MVIFNILVFTNWCSTGSNKPKYKQNKIDFERTMWSTESQPVCPLQALKMEPVPCSSHPLLTISKMRANKRF